MPIPSFTYPNRELSSQSLLKQFVRELYHVLQHLAMNRPDHDGGPLPLIPERAPDVAAAWIDVQVLFPELFETINSLEDRRIFAHGLQIAQLWLKLGNVAYWSARANAAANLGANIWRRTIRHLLDAINTLLKSLLEATSFGSAIAEFKDAIKDAIDDVVDDD